MASSRPNYLSVILSVALVLLLIGIFLLTAAYGNRLVALYKEKVDIWLELKSDISESEVARVVGSVRSQPFVKKETLTFITKEQAAATMRRDLGDESLLEDLPNLMRNVVRFNVKSAFLTSDSLASWRTEIRQDSAVADVFFEAVSLGNTEANVQKISYLVLGLAFLLIIGAIALIHNTIRLALYANRFLIKNQQLVGASWGFISAPYIRRGVLNGVLSGLLAVSVLSVLVELGLQAIPDFSSIHTPGTLIILGLLLVVLGAVIGGLSSWIVVNKFLKLRIEELY
jgi:cell division transport system permease protein